MSWTRVFVCATLAALLVLTITNVVDSAAVKHEVQAEEPKGEEPDMFVPEAEATGFIRRRTRRSEEYYREMLDEQRERSGSAHRDYEYRKRAYLQQLEEERNERYERRRQQLWRAYHYGGYYPYYHYWHY